MAYLKEKLGIKSRDAVTISRGANKLGTGRTRRTAGLILTEALLAVSLLMVGSIALGSLINNAIQTTEISKNFMIGQNLATEATEAVKKIRDTNWMINPNKKSYWLCLAPNRDCTSGSGGLPGTGDMAQVSGSDYIVDITDENKWVLSPLTYPSELDIRHPGAQVAQQEQFRLVKLASGGYAVSDPQITSDPSIFYRSVRFLEIGAADEYAVFLVRVQWKEGSEVRTIDRVNTIYNYL